MTLVTTALTYDSARKRSLGDQTLVLEFFDPNASLDAPIYPEDAFKN
jgi:hypothetical protein